MRRKLESITFQLHPPELFEMKIFTRLLVIAIDLILRCSTDDLSSCEALKTKCFHVAALIPARAGSKGIKDKNLSVLGNETLLSRTLRIVNEVEIFHSIWVLTDGKSIANEALGQGAKVHWRDPRTATDNASTVSAVEDFLQEHTYYNIVAVIQCTSPFLQKTHLLKALKTMMKADADCLFSVTRSFQLRWTERKKDFVTPLNFNPKKRPRRQDWSGELVENGMFYFAKSELIFRDGVLQNDRCKTLEIPKQFSLEIDTEVDLLLARAMLPLLENYQSGNFYKKLGT